MVYYPNFFLIWVGISQIKNMARSHLKVLVQLAKIDGEFDQSEEEFIRKIGRANGLEEEEIENLIRNTNTEEGIPENLSLLSADDKFEYMYSIVQLMRIDGKLHKDEIKFCIKITEMLGYEEQALFEFITATYSDPKETYNKELIKKKMSAYFNSKNPGNDQPPS